MSSTPARTCFSPVNVVCVPGAIVGMTGAAPGRADVSPSTANAVEPAPEPAAIAVAPTPRPTALLNVRLLIMSESSLQSCLPTLVRPSVGHISHMTPRLRRVRRSPYAVIRLFSQRDGGAILEDSRGPAADGPACPKGLVVNRTPVVLIHGAWLHKSSWESWAERFASSGFAVHVPGWPGEAASAAEGRRDPDPSRDLGLENLVAHYEVFVRSLDIPPVLIGHSLGGLMVQHLFSLGLGRAAVALAPMPADGAWQDPPRNGFRSLGLTGSGDHRGFVPLPRSQFRHTFANTVGEDEAARPFERHVVPGP